MLRKLFYAMTALMFGALILASLDYRGVLWHTELLARRYEVRGIDVSHHQGLINWDSVGAQGLSFAYVKATEATGHVDSYFFYNWKQARAKGLATGAYHFFSMQESGAEQGEYYISVVPLEDDSLPPVIDLEVSLAYPREDVVREVVAMSDVLEEHYGKKPIIYLDENVYEAFVKGSSLGNPIWIREIYVHPLLLGNIGWSLWQYSSRGSVSGIRGAVDLDVYRGSGEQFREEFGLN